jgi:hypothetical protein
MDMRLALITLTGATLLLVGCGAIHTFRDDAAASKGVPAPVAKDCSKGGVTCPPLNRRQYYDDRTARYYYFDQATGRYYWENGEPRF